MTEQEVLRRLLGLEARMTRMENGVRVDQNIVRVDGDLLVSGNVVAKLTDWVPDADPWVYVSSSSFKIVGKDVRSKHGIGTKYKMVNGSAKQGYSLGAVMSGSDTLVSFVGDDALGNTAITGNYYSYDETPTGFPDWVSYTSTVTGFTATPTVTLMLRIIRKNMEIYLDAITGTSNATTLTFTIPVVASATISVLGLCGARDNSVVLGPPGHLTCISGSNIIGAYKAFISSAWTNSGIKTIWPAMFSVPI